MHMGDVTSDRVRQHRDELVRRVTAADGADVVFAEASARLRKAVPYDAAAWLMTDPVTGLPTAPSRVEGVDATPGLCSAHWRHELLVDDVNLFRDLARRTSPASSLRATGDPQRSGRFRRFMRPFGFTDELRAVLRVGDAPWGVVTLWRRDGRAAFSTEETEVVASLSAPMGEALRTKARPGEAVGRVAHEDRPGMMVFGRGGELLSVNDVTEAWLAELPPNERAPTALGIELPMCVVVTAMRASTSLEAGRDGTARTRVRSRRGRWLVCHASCVRAADGAVDSIVVVIEAATAAQLAPIVVEAYALSEREQQVTRLIARGWGTSEIAAELRLSAHTVRDHVKAIFSKVGVSRRGELVAALYSEFYEPLHLAEAPQSGAAATPSEAAPRTFGAPSW